MDKTIIEQKIKEVTAKIVREFSPEKVILFGSWAWGNPGPDSDVDLLVIRDSAKPRIERQMELRDSLRDAGIPMDLLVYTPSEIKEKIEKDRNLFLEDIVNNGAVLYAAH